MKKEVMQIYSIPEGKICIVSNGIVPDRIKSAVDPIGIKKNMRLCPLSA